MSSNILEQRSFTGGMNNDDKYSSLADNEYINAQNMRFGDATEAGKALNMQTVPGTTLLYNRLPTQGIDSNLGTCDDEGRQRILFFTYNSAGFHQISCFDAPSLTTYIVLLDSQVTGGLGFDSLHYIHSSFVNNNCLYWTDNNMEPRRVNIEAGIKLNQPLYVTTVIPYVTPIDVSVISLIRRQPGLVPSQIKTTQTTPVVVNNFLTRDAFEFCYRYIYRDFEIGTLSGLSTLANFNLDADTFNRIDVSVPFQEIIQQDVIQIDLVAKYLVSGVYFIIKSWQQSLPA